MTDSMTSQNIDLSSWETVYGYKMCDLIFSAKFVSPFLLGHSVYGYKMCDLILSAKFV